jgi:hypothetical protein
MFHRHKWTDWVVTEEGILTWFHSQVGWYLVQERRCLSCGKTQVSDQANYGGVSEALASRHPRKVRVPRKDGVSA